MKREKLFAKTRFNRLHLMAGLLGAMCLLTSCGAVPEPTKTIDGAEWDSSWTTVGGHVGAEVPEGYTELRNEDLLNEGHTYYVVWSKGEAVKYTDHNEKEVTTYDGQIHLLAEEAKDEDSAATDAAQWQSVADERYTYTDTCTAEYGGVSYDICSYDFPDDGGPASQGASANAVLGKWAIHVDIIMANGENPADVMDSFLSGLHIAQ